MPTKSDYLIDLIFKKLKSYKGKEIFLGKENLNRFISLLFQENWIQGEFNQSCYNWTKFWYVVMYNFSSLTIILIITFIVSLYFLFKVTSNTNN